MSSENDKIHGRKRQKLIGSIHERSIIDNVSYDKVIFKLLLIKGVDVVIVSKKIEYP